MLCPARTHHPCALSCRCDGYDTMIAGCHGHPCRHTCATQCDPRRLPAHHRRGNKAPSSDAHLGYAASPARTLGRLDWAAHRAAWVAGAARTVHPGRPGLDSLADYRAAPVLLASLTRSPWMAVLTHQPTIHTPTLPTLARHSSRTASRPSIVKPYRASTASSQRGTPATLVRRISLSSASSFAMRPLRKIGGS